MLSQICCVVCLLVVSSSVALYTYHSIDLFNQSEVYGAKCNTQTRSKEYCATLSPEEQSIFEHNLHCYDLTNIDMDKTPSGALSQSLL